MSDHAQGKLPVTVLLAAKNEAVNLPRCLSALSPAKRVVVLDSQSTYATAAIAEAHRAKVVQFDYHGGYPKKRQWALENVQIDTPWVLLLDADEVVPPPLWAEVSKTISDQPLADAFMITKGFHFLGRRMRRGGFSHAAVLLFGTCRARFERLFDDDLGGLDMEVHERLLVVGAIGRIAPRLFGNSQEMRRSIKALIIRLPFEHWLWFGYHYFVPLGFLEVRAGLIACQIRSSYIAHVRAKMYELQLRENRQLKSD